MRLLPVSLSDFQGHNRHTCRDQQGAFDQTAADLPDANHFVLSACQRCISTWYDSLS